MTNKSLPPSRTADQFVVRLPDGMRDKLKDAAESNNRSANAEIVVRLEQSFEGMPEPAMQSLLARLEHQLAEAEFQLSNECLATHELAVYLASVLDRMPPTTREALISKEEEAYFGDALGVALGYESDELMAESRKKSDVVSVTLHRMKEASEKLRASQQSKNKQGEVATPKRRMKLDRPKQ